MICLLASWPKSGNTWMRSLICNYLKGKQVSINEMAKTIPIDSSRGIWTEYLGMPNYEGMDGVNNRVKMYKTLSEKIGDKRLFLKSHSANLTINKHQMFDMKYIERVVHIVRNPFDVLPSFAHHMGLGIEDAWAKMQKDSLAMNGSEKQHREVSSSWMLHTNSFLSISNNPDRYLLVRYEDLKMKPITTFKKVVEFVGLTYSEERLVGAIYRSSFENLKSQEETDGFKEKAKDRTFFRKGQIGSFKDDVPEKIREEMKVKYTEICKKLKYQIK